MNDITLLEKLQQPVEMVEYNTKGFRFYSHQGSGSIENKPKYKQNQVTKILPKGPLYIYQKTLMKEISGIAIFYTHVFAKTS